MGCKQEASESPPLWSVELDEVLAPVPRKWRREGLGYYLPALAADEGERRLRALADVAPWCNHLGYADGLLLVASNAQDARRVYKDLERVWAPERDSA